MTLYCVGVLLAFGYILVLAASPAVAVRIGASREMFILKQVIFLAVAGIVTLLVSTMSREAIRKMALIGGGLALLATLMTLVHGLEIKGARRWIALPFMSVQPSEFFKPFFAIVTAWLLAKRRQTTRDGKMLHFPGMIIAFGVYAVILFLLKSQPDIGMLSVVTMVFFVQLFVDGLPLIFVGAGIGAMIAAFIGAFIAFSHVRSRVERFLHPNLGDHYQIDMALRAFGNGGLLGRGPGKPREGSTPRCPCGFRFRRCGGGIWHDRLRAVIGVFLVMVIRSLQRVLREQDPFVIVAVSGLIAGFGLQAFINMGSTLHLIPTKG